jgi:hypothetical protein
MAFARQKLITELLTLVLDNSLFSDYNRFIRAAHTSAAASQKERTHMLRHQNPTALFSTESLSGKFAIISIENHPVWGESITWWGNGAGFCSDSGLAHIFETSEKANQAVKRMRPRNAESAHIVIFE